MTSLEVVKVFIKRAQEVNQLINAVVEERFKLAIEEANKVDRFIDSLDNDEAIVQKIENETPFLGVPVTVKESCSLSGESVI